MDTTSQYIACISAQSDFGRGTFVEADPHVWGAVDPGRLRAFAHRLAEPLVQLADVLEVLAGNGWTFARATVEPGSLIAEIHKRGTSAVLYNDLACLPPSLLEWVNQAGVFISSDNGSTSGVLVVRHTPRGWHILPPGS